MTVKDLLNIEINKYNMGFFDYTFTVENYKTMYGIIVNNNMYSINKEGKYRGVVANPNTGYIKQFYHLERNL